MKELHEYSLGSYRQGPLYGRVKALLMDYIAALPDHVEYLPYEYVMEKQLHVSRESVRRALQELRNIGMIKTVRNRGSKIIRRRLSGPAVADTDLLQDRQFAFIFVSNTESRERDYGYLPWNVSSALEKVLSMHGSTLLMYDMRGSEYREGENKLVTELMRQKINAAVIHYNREIDIGKLSLLLLGHDIKPVILFRSMSHFEDHKHCFPRGTDFVCMNNERALYEKLEKSCKSTRNIFYVTHENDRGWSDSRSHAVELFCREYSVKFTRLTMDIPKSDLLTLEERRYCGYNAIISVLEELRDGKETMILAANDEYAIGVLDALTELKLSLPRVQLIGYDNEIDCRKYKISTFDFNADEFAAEAFYLLKCYIKNPEESLRISNGRLINSTYIHRSTAL